MAGEIGLGQFFGGSSGLSQQASQGCAGVAVAHRLGEFGFPGIQCCGCDQRIGWLLIVQLCQLHTMCKQLQAAGKLFHGGGIGCQACRQLRQPLHSLALITRHQLQELVLLATVEPDDGGEVGQLFVGEHMRAGRHHVVHIAGVEHQHFVAQRGGFALVEKPQRARQAAGVEELVANGQHHIHVAGVGQLLADVAVFVAGIGGAGGHDETGAATAVEVGIEILDPQAVGVGDGAGLGIGTWQAERQAAVDIHLRGHFLGIDPIHIEGRVGHDEIALANQVLGLIVKGIALADIGGIEAVHHQVHARQLGVGVALFLAVEGHQFIDGGMAHVFDEVAGLHEHAG